MLPSLSMAARNSRPKPSLSSTATPLASQCGLIVVECSQGPASSAQQTKESSPIGLMRTCAGASFAISASMAQASRYEMHCTREILGSYWIGKFEADARVDGGSILPAVDLRIRCH